MLSSQKREQWEAQMRGREKFRAYLKARTLAAYRAFTGNPNAIIPRKRKRKRRSSLP